MIDIIPAIDIIKGKCVRLTEGDFNRRKIYDYDPLYLAVRFQETGIRWLHLIDLDGARLKKIMNIQVLENIASRTSLMVEWGGGVTSADDIRTLLHAGASRVVIGSMAATQPETVKQWVQEFSAERIVIGADVRGSRIAIDGWKKQSRYELMEFIGMWFENGARTFLCTDISKDGMLKGTSLELYRELKKNYQQVAIIASGGITRATEIKELEEAGIAAAVIGKALYEGTITLDELKEFL